MIKQRSTSPTPRQIAFIHEYMKDRNGTQAAIRAGYAPGSAKVTASRLLTKANVAAEISRLEAEHAATAGLEVVDILKRLQAIAWEGKPSSKQVPALKLLLEHLKGQTHTQQGDTKNIQNNIVVLAESMKLMERMRERNAQFAKTVE